MSSWRKVWAPALVSLSSGILASAALLAFWPNHQEYVVPVDGVVVPSWTPFTRVPVRPVREPVPSSAYYPPGYTPHGTASPGR
jgi:hypothetical protein